MATIVGTAGDDLLAGGAGDDIITGLGGADIIDGGDGADDIDGGDGDDSLYGGVGADILKGGNGFDFARYDTASAGVTVSLAAEVAGTGDALGDTFDHVEGLVGSQFDDTLLGTGVANTLYGLEGDDQISGRGGNDQLLGGLGSDILHGDGGADTLFGDEDADNLYGDAGDDQLYGGLGADSLDGGADFDFTRYDYATSGVTLSLAAGSGSAGEAAGDTFVDIEGVVGSQYADVLNGNAGYNSLYGLAGDDQLLGGDGDNDLSGGDGDDVLTGGSGADALDGGAGFDTVRYDNSAAGVVVYLSTGEGRQGAAGDHLTSIESLVGSNFVDVFSGTSNGSSNILYGMGGDDLINGGTAADQLFGGNGDDSLVGLEGDDVIYGGAGADRLAGGDGNDQLYGGAGADRFEGDAGFDFARYDDEAAVTVNLSTGATGGAALGDVFIAVDGLIGSAFNDSLTANDGVNSLYGLAGADTLRGLGDADSLYGGDGNDSLYGGTGADVIDGGANFDFARYDDLASAVTVDLGTGVTGGAAAGDILTSIEGLVGSNFADTLTGDAGANTIYAQGGNDIVNGGAGQDQLYGGAGADHFVFSSLETTDLGADQIFDFDAVAGDQIDLTAIDANSGVGGDQAFTLVGSFSGAAGQAVLTYNVGQDVTHMSFDTNGDSLADLYLLLSGEITTGQGFLL
jgi:Ca2+-binding RTX toxin-like protein